MSDEEKKSKTIYQPGTTPSPEELPPDVDLNADDYPGDSIEGGQPPPSSPPPYEESKKNYLLFIGIGVLVFVGILFFIIKILFFGKQGKSKVELVYWGLWEDKAVVQPLIEKYQRANKNVIITYEKKDSKDYLAKLLARSKNGRGPDIFRYHNTWLAELRTLVAPLPKKIMSDKQFENTFYPVHQKDLKVGRYYYGIPLEIDGLILVYNDGLFKKAAINSPPKTWDDLINDLSKLTVKDRSGRIIVSAVALGTANNIAHFSDIFGLMLLENGVDLKTLDSEGGAQVLKSYRRFAEEPKAVWNTTMPNSILAFSQEKVAMIFVPSWWIGVIKKANPEIEIKTAPLPIVPGGEQIALANYWVEGVSKYSRHQKEAWKFLNFLVEKENLTQLYKEQAKTRLFGEPYSRVDLAKTLIQNQYVGAVIKQAQYYQSLPLISRTYDDGLNDRIIDYLSNAINATTQGVGYRKAMATAQKGINQILSKYELN